MIQICDDKLLIFNLLLLMSVLACETSEILTFTAHERGKVEIQCPYEAKFKEDKKYLCTGECPRLFKDKAVESESGAKDKRFSLTDNKTAHIFTVTITDLRTEDRGKYWCGIKTGFGNYDYNREIYLEIKHVSRVSGVTGEHLNIPCCYESELKDSVKFICKASSTSLCEKSAIKVSSEKKSNGRFSLRDNASAGVFTVNIADLTEEDSGIYWCGAVQRGQGHKNKWISVTDLKIPAVTSERTPPKPTTATASFHTSKPVTAADTASDKTVTSSPSSSSSPSPSVLMFFSPSANAVSPKPQPGFTPVIMVMVIGILTGFGFSLFIYLRQIRKAKGNCLSHINLLDIESFLFSFAIVNLSIFIVKPDFRATNLHTASKERSLIDFVTNQKIWCHKTGTQPKDVVHGPTENLPSGDTGETKEATHTVYDYEDISSSLDHPDYSLVLPAFAENDASVYALAQLPSSPSDNLTYSSIRFTAAHHSDRTSDGQETCDYATVRPKD